MPTIRIDEEVFAWLKSRAIPLVDSPNSVLRREAGLLSIGRHVKGGSKIKCTVIDKFKKKK